MVDVIIEDEVLELVEPHDVIRIDTAVIFQAGASDLLFTSALMPDNESQATVAVISTMLALRFESEPFRLASTLAEGVHNVAAVEVLNLGNHGVAILADNLAVDCEVKHLDKFCSHNSKSGCASFPIQPLVVDFTFGGIGFAKLDVERFAISSGLFLKAGDDFLDVLALHFRDGVGIFHDLCLLA